MKNRSTEIAEVRVYSAWLVYVRVLLLLLFAALFGALVYSIFTQNVGGCTAGIIVGISLGLFYQSAGRMVLRDLRRRRDRAQAGLSS